MLNCMAQQGGNAQVRFQPITGNLLAAATDKVVSIFDVENDRQTHSFQVCFQDLKVINVMLLHAVNELVLCVCLVTILSPS